MDPDLPEEGATLDSPPVMTPATGRMKKVKRPKRKTAAPPESSWDSLVTPRHGAQPLAGGEV